MYHEKLSLKQFDTAIQICFHYLMYYVHVRTFQQISNTIINLALLSNQYWAKYGQKTVVHEITTTVHI